MTLSTSRYIEKFAGKFFRICGHALLWSIFAGFTVVTGCGSEESSVVLLTPVAEGVQILNPFSLDVVLNKPAPKNISVTITNPLPDLMTISPLEFEILEGDSSEAVQIKQIQTLDSGEQRRGTLVITLNTDPPSAVEWDFSLVGPEI